MKTFERKCIRNLNHPKYGQLLKKDKKYTTSDLKEGKVCVYSKYWFWIEKEYFKGEKVLTEENELYKFLTRSK